MAVGAKQFDDGVAINGFPNFGKNSEGGFSIVNTSSYLKFDAAANITTLPLYIYIIYVNCSTSSICRLLIQIRSVRWPVRLRTLALFVFTFNPITFAFLSTARVIR